MNGFRAVIKEMASKLALDEQEGGLVCPSCQGGEKGDKSFSLRRDVTRAYYICHRASCNIQGSVNMSAIDVPPPRTKVPDKEYVDTLVALPQNVKDILHTRYGLKDFDSFGLRWAPLWDKGKGRVAIPIWDRFRNRQGYVFRTLEKDVKPKSVTMMTGSESASMSWYLNKQSRKATAFDLQQPVVLVEDPFSGMRASYFAHVGVLLGTHLSDSKLQEIQRAKPSDCIIALDQDATAKAATMMGKLAGILNSVSIRELTKDLKDCTDEEIKGVLKL